MGCSSSKTLPLPVVPTIVKRDHVTAPIDASCRHRETRCLENCIIVWLIAPASIQVDNVIEQLRRTVCTLRTFTDPDACVTYIKNIREEKLFLILSSEMNQFVERVHDLPQIEKTYIFDGLSQKIENDNDQIFRDIPDLCEQLRQDVELCEFDQVAVTALAPEAASPKQTASFLYAQLIKEILFRLKFENEAKSVFADFCRVHYASDNEQLNKIDDFERNYRPQKVLWWLTRSCFVSRILHRAQRTQEIDILHKMGFLIRHVHIQLTILHEKMASLTRDTLIVYRGKSMSSNDFETLVRSNCGGYFSFSNFLTARFDKDMAVDFTLRRVAAHPEMMAILFEIHIDPTMRNLMNPFAVLNNFDADVKSDKGEICFTISTVFRIESIKQVADNPTNMWTVKLTFVDDNDQQLYRLVAPLRSIEVHANPLAHMGKLLIEMGEYSRAEQFYLQMLLDPSVLGQPSRLFRVHNGLASIFTYKNEHTKALEHYQSALKVSLSYLQPEHPDLARIYSAIGSSYFNNGDYVQAMQNYERAAQLIEHSIQPPDQEFLDDLHSRIANTKELVERNK